MVANAANSMTGSLNLQFSSDADLKPMENTNMRMNGGEKAKDAPEVTYTQKAAAGDTYTYGETAYTVNAGYTIYEGSDSKPYYKADGSEKYILITTENVSTVLTRTSTGD